MKRITLILSLGLYFITTISAVKANPDIFERTSDSSSYYPRNNYNDNGYRRAAPVVREPAPLPSAPRAEPNLANENQLRAQVENLQAQMARMAQDIADLKREVLYGKQPWEAASPNASAPSKASIKD